MKNKKKKYKNYETIGSYALCNYGGILIKAIEDDLLIYQNNANTWFYQAKIYYNRKGEAFFNYSNRRVYLKEVMQCNY